MSPKLLFFGIVFICYVNSQDYLRAYYNEHYDCGKTMGFVDYEIGKCYAPLLCSYAFCFDCIGEYQTEFVPCTNCSFSKTRSFRIDYSSNNISQTDFTSPDCSGEGSVDFNLELGCLDLSFLYPCISSFEFKIRGNSSNTSHSSHSSLSLSDESMLSEYVNEYYTSSASSLLRTAALILSFSLFFLFIY